ncbi:hypothetical protein ACHAXN_005563 [Cyclotella atomus]
MSETNSHPPEPSPPTDFSSCSIESTLSVPTRYIFLKTQSGQNTFLFSRSEVSTLLQVSMLASELDVILSLTYESLDRCTKCKLYRECIESRNDNNSVYLRALLPLLDVHQETAEGALKCVTKEKEFGIHSILRGLDDCAVELKKFSEQNWNMAEQLSYMMSGSSNQLSNEKKAIAELEDAVAERIFHFKDMSSLMDGDDTSNFEPMDEFCNALFSKIRDVERAVDPSASQMNAAQALALLGADGMEED